MEPTVKLVKQYNDILDSIQKNLYGEKSMSLHIHGKVSHAQVQAKIREYSGVKVDSVPKLPDKV
jgi:predicted Zn-dependent peptidase